MLNSIQSYKMFAKNRTFTHSKPTESQINQDKILITGQPFQIRPL